MQPGRKPSPAEPAPATRFGANRSDHAGPPEQPEPRRSVSRRSALAEGRNWLYEPRTAVLIVLGGAAETEWTDVEVVRI